MLASTTVNSNAEIGTCPITHETFRNPVTATDGHTYEREAITHWFKQSNTSPLTGVKLQDKTVVPNEEIKKLIFCQLVNKISNEKNTNRFTDATEVLEEAAQLGFEFRSEIYASLHKSGNMPTKIYSQLISMHSRIKSRNLEPHLTACREALNQKRLAFARCCGGPIVILSTIAGLGALCILFGNKAVSSHIDSGQNATNITALNRTSVVDVHHEGSELTTFGTITISLMALMIFALFMYCASIIDNPTCSFWHDYTQASKKYEESKQTYHSLAAKADSQLSKAFNTVIIFLLKNGYHPTQKENSALREICCNNEINELLLLLATHTRDIESGGSIKNSLETERQSYAVNNSSVLFSKKDRKNTMTKTKVPATSFIAS